MNFGTPPFQTPDCDRISLAGCSSAHALGLGCNQGSEWTGDLGPILKGRFRLANNDSLGDTVFHLYVRL